MPILLRSDRIAAIVVVPNPAKGSSMVSPRSENMFIKRYGISVG